MPSQFVKRQSVEDNRRVTAILSKTLVQINEKIGGVAWEVSTSKNSALEKSVVHGGIGISKGKNGFTLSFVGSVDQNGTQFKNFCKTGYKTKDAN